MSAWLHRGGWSGIGGPRTVALIAAPGNQPSVEAVARVITSGADRSVILASMDSHLGAPTPAFALAQADGSRVTVDLCGGIVVDLHGPSGPNTVNADPRLPLTTFEAVGPLRIILRPQAPQHSIPPPEPLLAGLFPASAVVLDVPGTPSPGDASSMVDPSPGSTEVPADPELDHDLDYEHLFEGTVFRAEGLGIEPPPGDAAGQPPGAEPATPPHAGPPRPAPPLPGPSRPDGSPRPTGMITGAPPGPSVGPVPGMAGRPGTGAGPDRPPGPPRRPGGLIDQVPGMGPPPPSPPVEPPPAGRPPLAAMPPAEPPRPAAPAAPAAPPAPPTRGLETDRGPTPPTPPAPAPPPRHTPMPPPATGPTPTPKPGVAPSPGPAPAAAPPPAASSEDTSWGLDAETQLRGASRTTVSPDSADAASPDAPTVPAVHCPAGHPNPTHAEGCRVCGASLVDRAITTISRPVLGILRFSDGQVVELRTHLVIGRSPSTSLAVEGEATERVTVVDPLISRTHLVVQLDGWQVRVTDRDSKNHTFLDLPGRPRFQLRSGESYPLPIGGTVLLGGEVSATYEVQPPEVRR